MYSIHISDVRSFRACRRQWNWSSRLRNNLESVVPYPPFFTGKAIHAALEFFYQDKETFYETLDKYFKKERENLEQLGELWPHEVEKIQEQIDLIEGMIDHYVLWQNADESKYSDRNLEFIDMEIDFSVPFIPSANYEGRLDGLVRQKETGEYFIWETKTAMSIESLLKGLVLDEQSTMYLWAARQIFDFPIKGVLYNILRKKSPTAPRLLQSGLLSAAKSLDSTTYHFMHVIRAVHPDWEQDTIDEFYGDFLAYLQANNSRYFMRYPVYKTEFEIDGVVDNIKATAFEMLNPEIAVYPNPGWSTCQFCTFKSPCVALSMEGNYKALLESEYQVRQSHTSMRSEDDRE